MINKLHWLAVVVVCALSAPAFADPVKVVAAENFYGDMATQIGGANVTSNYPNDNYGTYAAYSSDYATYSTDFPKYYTYVSQQVATDPNTGDSGVQLVDPPLGRGDIAGEGVDACLAV